MLIFYSFKPHTIKYYEIMSEMKNSTVTFGNSIAICMSKYADFKGRASRAEYWWFYLFALLLSWAALAIDPTQMVSQLVNLALLMPVLAAGARRLHDTGRSGWWQLLVLTIVGIILLIVWWASEGSQEENEYGQSS